MGTVRAPVALASANAALAVDWPWRTAVRAVGRVASGMVGTLVPFSTVSAPFVRQCPRVSVLSQTSTLPVLWQGRGGVVGREGAPFRPPDAPRMHVQSTDARSLQSGRWWSPES